MKTGKWQITLALALMATAMVLYYLQITIFHAERDTFFYLLQDLAFVPIQVLLVTFIVDRFLRIRERMALLKKLNMVIGAFFSEVGTKLLTYFVAFDTDAGPLAGRLLVNASWTDRRFDWSQSRDQSCKVGGRRGRAQHPPAGPRLPEPRPHRVQPVRLALHEDD